MTKEETLKKQRMRGLLILGLVGLAALGAVAVAAEWSERGGRKGATSQSQPMELAGMWLGMRLSGTDSLSARQLGVPPTVKGVVVAEMTPGVSARAAGAGLQPGDVVIRVDGNDVENLDELNQLTGELDIGRQLPMDVLRQGQPMSVVLPPPPLAMQAPTATPVGLQRAAGWYGPGACPRGGWGQNLNPNCPVNTWGAR